SLRLRAWCVWFIRMTCGGPFMASAPPALLIAAFASCLFWYIECTWKTFQYAFYERINEIEDFFAGKGKKPDPLQIGRAWYARWSTLGTHKFCCIMAWPRVALPHALVALLGVVLFGLNVAGLVRV